jgi:hypothetical protein
MPSDRKRFTHAFTETKLISVWLTDVMNRINDCKMSDFARLLPGL